MKPGRVYLITNTVNGKRYVGKTHRASRKRWADHCSAAKRGSQYPLHCAIRKYDKDAFAVVELTSGLSFAAANLASREKCARPALGYAAPLQAAV
jgi:hypothetical protein